jgi:DNA (cytosine-5)-methyltransferase 1
MRVGSLFSGIGGLDLGFERAGFEIAWQVEIDPYCRKVLAKHWPDIPRYEDIRNIGAHNLEPVDVLVGGFPCQDISTAGKKEGIGGSRSSLWSEYARLICELRPRYVVVENVANLLSMGLGRVLGDLAESGYDAEWDCLPAVAFGAPHRRDRLFVVAYPAEHGRGQQRITHEYERQRQEMGRGEQPGGYGGDRPLAHPKRPRLQGGTGAGIFRAIEFTRYREKSRRQWEVEPAVGRVADGFPRRIHQLRGLGNAVVPQVAEFLARCIWAHASESIAERSNG